MEMILEKKTKKVWKKKLITKDGTLALKFSKEYEAQTKTYFLNGLWTVEVFENE